MRTLIIVGIMAIGAYHGILHPVVAALGYLAFMLTDFIVNPTTIRVTDTDMAIVKFDFD